MPGQLQTKNISDVKCLLRTIVIPSQFSCFEKNRERKKCRPVEFDSFIAFWRGRHKYGSLHGRTVGSGGVGEAPPQFLVFQLILSQPSVADYAQHITTGPPKFLEFAPPLHGDVTLHKSSF